MQIDSTYYTFDTAWEKFLHILPKYMNSHYYDIMSYFCGLAGFLLLLVIRHRIKNFNRRNIEKKFSYDLYRREPVMLKPIMIYRLTNFIIPVLAALVSLVCFEIIAFLSERIHAKTIWLGIIPFIPIALYTVYEMWESGILGAILSIVITYMIFKYNKQYCMEFEDHHKACYAIRIMVRVFGMLGILFQILPPYRDIIRLLREKIRDKHEKGKDVVKSEEMIN